MKKTTLLFLLLFLFLTWSCTEIVHQGTILNACVDFEGGEFYTDSGGTLLNYSNNESSTIQFCAEPGETVTIEFVLFELEQSLDSSTISGSNSSDGTYEGSNSPGNVTSLLGGCLSFVFNSNSSNTSLGWEALISVTSDCSTLNVTNESIENKIKLFPNPATNLVTISAHSSIQIEKITLFDLSGKLIMNNKIQIFQNENVIDISNIVSGVYLIQIDSNEESIMKRLIIN